MTHVAMTLTPDLPLSPTPIALSPDGLTLAMSAGNQIVLRRLDNPKLTALPGTERHGWPGADRNCQSKWHSHQRRE